jgi:AAA family ATP:ADP antiporter
VLYIGAGMFLVAVVLQRLLLAEWHRIAPDAGTGSGQTSERDRALGGNPFAGFMLVVRNPYLRGIALFIAGISAVNTFLYFEQLELVQEKFEELAARTQVFASLDTMVQSLVIVTQLTLTGFIATRLGVIALLVIIPIIMVFGLTVFAAFGTFSVLAAAMVIRRWANTPSSARGARCCSARWTARASTRPRTSATSRCTASRTPAFAQIKKALDAVGMGGAAQALTAAVVARAVGDQWLVAGPPVRKGKVRTER